MNPVYHDQARKNPPRVADLKRCNKISEKDYKNVSLWKTKLQLNYFRIKYTHIREFLRTAIKTSRFNLPLAQPPPKKVLVNMMQ